MRLVLFGFEVPFNDKVVSVWVRGLVLGVSVRIRKAMSIKIGFSVRLNLCTFQLWA